MCFPEVFSKVKQKHLLTIMKHMYLEVQKITYKLLSKYRKRENWINWDLTMILGLLLTSEGKTVFSLYDYSLKTPWEVSSYDWSKHWYICLYLCVFKLPTNFKLQGKHNLKWRFWIWKTDRNRLLTKRGNLSERIGFFYLSGWLLSYLTLSSW